MRNYLEKIKSRKLATTIALTILLFLSGLVYMTRVEESDTDSDLHEEHHYKQT